MLRKRARNKKFFVTCLDTILSTYMQGSISKKLKFYLACLVYPKDVKKPENFGLLKPDEMTGDAALAMIETIHGILYCYSHEKMRTFTRIPELATLFLIFEASDGVEDFHEDPKVEESLRDIKEMCEQTLS